MAKKNAAGIIGGGKKEDRREMDFYPAPSEVTLALLDFLNLPIEAKIWEPGCGDGAMSKIILRKGYECYSTDIRKTDFCQDQYNFLSGSLPYKADAIITNPPFNVAKHFIIRAIKSAPIVAMVLKSQYWHAIDRQPLFNKHPPAWILPLAWRPDFTGDGFSLMDCIWTVWIQGDSLTKYQPLIKPKYLFKNDHLSDYKPEVKSKNQTALF